MADGGEGAGVEFLRVPRDQLVTIDIFTSQVDSIEPLSSDEDSEQ